MKLLEEIKFLFSGVFEILFGEDFANIDPILKPSARAEFGDYQANFAMSLAKKLKKSPRDIANLVVTELSNNKKFNQVFEKIEIAGPGFINLWLNTNNLKV